MHSKSMEITDRLDIGLYELASAVSRPGFFSCGEIKADLNKVGKWSRDNSYVIQGTSFDKWLKMERGMGSVAQNLLGSLLTEKRTCRL